MVLTAWAAPRPGQGGLMKVAVPIADGKLCMHFGHCQQFALLDVDEAKREVGARTAVTPPPHAPGVLPRWLHEQGVTIVIAGGMGHRAQSLFAEHGIRVIVGAPGEAPERLVEEYLRGSLVCGANVCDH